MIRSTAIELLRRYSAAQPLPQFMYYLYRQTAINNLNSDRKMFAVYVNPYTADLIYSNKTITHSVVLSSKYCLQRVPCFYVF